MERTTNARPATGGSYRYYLLFLLLLIFAFSHVDRLALGLLLQHIGADLDLTDTQLGLLGGIAFALFYSVMGIPIARWADRGNRVTIIAITTALWSVGACVYGIAGNFWQLLLIRIGVAMGKSGVVPPAQSLIAHHFTRAERPRAMAIYLVGGPLSAVMGYSVAGWLNELYGWRITFMLLSLPGVCLAMLAWFTLREPRVQTPAAVPTAIAQPSLTAVCVILWSNRTFRRMLFCFALSFFSSYGMAQWQPAFFARSYGLQTVELGAWFTAIYGVGGVIGTYWGGAWASRYAGDDERQQLRMMGLVYLTFGIVAACVYLSPSSGLALVLMGLSTVGLSIVSGPFFAAIPMLVPREMRATAMALVLLVANFIGMGLGPLAAGILSDLFRPWAGEESLRCALLVLSPGYLACAWHLWRGSETVTADLEAEANC